MDSDSQDKYGVHAQRLSEIVEAALEDIDEAQLPKGWRDTLEEMATKGRFGSEEDPTEAEKFKEMLECEKERRETAESVGVSGDRLELYLDYFDAKKINFEKYRNNPEYCATLLGPLPHSGKSKGDYSSIAAMLEHEPGFPRTILLGRNGLKLTSNSLQVGLAQLASEGALK